MTQEEINKILELHKKWLDGHPDGVRADFRGKDLRGADFRGKDLSGADLSGADLSYADLRGADLSYADLRGANLRGADLRGADLRGADLRGANLSGANLSDADLSGANLLNIKANFQVYTIFGIGSANRQTIYIPTLDKIFCGCFTGTLEKFKKRIEETHKNNPEYLAQYRAAIVYFETLKGVK